MTQKHYMVQNMWRQKYFFWHTKNKISRFPKTIFKVFKVAFSDSRLFKVFKVHWQPCFSFSKRYFNRCRNILPQNTMLIDVLHKKLVWFSLFLRILLLKKSENSDLTVGFDLEIELHGKYLNQTNFLSV